jgi:DNA adenine methylase
LPLRKCRVGIAADIVPELIGIWKLVQDRPSDVADEYEKRWEELQIRKHLFFYEVRERFNSSRDPNDLLFLSRTCVNGLVRFNSKGDFNNSFHHTRPGISPGRFRRIVADWNRALHEIIFLAQDYRKTLEDCGPDDFVFLDPPYCGTRGRYRPLKPEITELVETLRNLNRRGAKWMLTLDGRAGGRTYQADIPHDLFAARFTLRTGTSPFPRVMEARVDSVEESVYLNFDPPSELTRTLLNYVQEPVSQG